jgi:signal peptidase I
LRFLFVPEGKSHGGLYSQLSGGRNQEINVRKGEIMTAFKRTRNPFIAALLSFFASGLGQIYNGTGALGLAFLFITIALPLLWAVLGWPRRFIGLAALAIVTTVFWLFVIVHAFFQARRIRETELKKYQKLGVYAFFVILSIGLTIFVPRKTWISFLGIAPFKFVTTSMMPTVHQDDFLMIGPRAYDSKAPQRGDLIVFIYPRDPSKRFLKRVIAIEGETVEIKNKQVFIDGQPLQEPYKIHEDSAVDNSRDNFGPLKIPAGRCFVLGDNRDNSNDSRFWGALPLANVKGKALYIYWAKDKKRIGLTPK